MRRNLRLACASFLLAAAGVGLLGVNTARCATITGTVVRMDDQGITVSRADGAEEHYNLAAGLQIPSDVRPGATIDLTLVTDSSGMQRVTAITTEATGMTGTAAAAPAPATGAATTESAAETPAAGTDTEELPATASPVWLFGMLGVLGLAGTFVIRRRRQHDEVKERLTVHSMPLR